MSVLAMDDVTEGSSLSGATSRHKLVFGRSVRTVTMMQSYASAAKLRGGGPILNRGSKTMSNIGLSPPRIVICSSASIRERTAEPQLCLATVKLFTSPGEGADLRAPRR